MSVDLSVQALQFFGAAGLGILLGLLYDFGRALRRERPRWTIPVDIVFCLIFFLAMGLTSIYTHGLRLYQCLGVFLGAGLYFLTVSPVVVRLWRRFFRSVRRLIRWLLTPLKKSVGFLRKLAKKLFPSSRKWGTIKMIPFSPKRHRTKEKRL